MPLRQTSAKIKVKSFFMSCSNPKLSRHRPIPIGFVTRTQGIVVVINCALGRIGRIGNWGAASAQDLGGTHYATSRKSALGVEEKLQFRDFRRTVGHATETASALHQIVKVA